MDMVRCSTSSSHITFDFHRPVTVRALELFDPDLRLVWNRKYGLFQVMSLRLKTTTFEVDGLGKVAWLEPTLVWEADWKEGLLRGDDPHPLIRKLYESDTLRFPNLHEMKDQQRRNHQETVRRKVRDNYRHAHRANRYQLHRALEPLYNFPAFTG